MTCEYVTLAGGATAIVCSGHRARRCKCGRSAPLLCDWKVPGGTCDKPICTACATSPAPDKDLCPEHAAAWRDWQAARANRAMSS